MKQLQCEMAQSQQRCTIQRPRGTRTSIGKRVLLRPPPPFLYVHSHLPSCRQIQCRIGMQDRIGLWNIFTMVTYRGAAERHSGVDSGRVPSVLSGCDLALAGESFVGWPLGSTSDVKNTSVASSSFPKAMIGKNFPRLILGALTGEKLTDEKLPQLTIRGPQL